MPYAPSTNVKVYTKDENGLALSGIFTGATKPSDAGVYAPGCVLTNKESGFAFRNRGTAASPVWIADAQVITADTSGTDAVSVFGEAGPKGAIRINDVWVLSLSTTASNITVENPAGTVVCTIAKGTNNNAIVRAAASVANLTVNAGTNLIIDSSAAAGSPGARVFISYTPV